AKDEKDRDVPNPLSDEEAKGILKRIQEEMPKIKVGFSKGQTVRIKEGPFVDFIGTVDQVFPDKGKVRVLVSFFGRETPVEMDYFQVEKQ
ncbi:MAG: KOW motif-containing protein, partial [Chloroflexota bacterium]